MRMLAEVTMGKPYTVVSWPGEHERVSRRVYPYTPSDVRDPLDEQTGWPKPGYWTPEHVRAAIRAAMDTLQRLPMPRDGRPAELRSAMPAVVREAMEAYGWADIKTTVRPTPAEIDHMERVFDWLFKVKDRRDVLILTGVALGCHYRAIGRIVGRHHEECRRAEKAALIRIALWLNGEKGLDC